MQYNHLPLHAVLLVAELQMNTVYAARKVTAFRVEAAHLSTPFGTDT